MNTKQNSGFTLIEVLITTAILAVLASVAIYNLKVDDQVSEAEALALKQILISYIPQQIKLYYLRGDSTEWSKRISQIQTEMTNWPHLQKASCVATVYKDNGIALKFKTTYQEQEQNNQLRDSLIKSPLVEEVINSGHNLKQFTVKYKLN